MKRISLFLLVFLLLFSLVTVHATDARLIDAADLLTDAEEAVLTERLDAVSAKYGVDVVIVTADTLEGKSPMAYADDYYDYHDYAPDGILLLVSMEDRDYWISTTGSCIRSFTDAGISYISDRFLPDLSAGDYAGAFAVFVDTTGEFLAQAESGDPYDIFHMPEMPREPFGWTRVAVCAVIAFIFGLIVIGSMKKKMHSVSYQRAATQYVRPGSLNVTLAQDFFLYRTVTRVARPKESSSSGGGSSTHTSSSGSSHGGGGGKF